MVKGSSLVQQLATEGLLFPKQKRGSPRRVDSGQGEARWLGGGRGLSLGRLRVVGHLRSAVPSADSASSFEQHHGCVVWPRHVVWAGEEVF